MFRTGSNFDKLLDKATSHLLMEPDWPSILQLCDLIRQNDVQPKYALASIKKKLFSPNQHTALYALLVLESMVKNCGKSHSFFCFHCDFMIGIVSRIPFA
jgi:growth factor-regulated tyrosine kinase substrate